MSLPSQPLCCLSHHRPWHPDLMPLTLVQLSLLCSQLVQILSVISILPCQMWQPSIFPIFCFLWCSSGLCSWSFAFIIYTTPLSTLISSLSFNHHLYADDTQLFFSFHPPDFDSNITHLQNALQQISPWMTANLLTLNSSKTEFLLIGLSKQLAKIHNSSLSTTKSARSLSFIFDNTFPFPIRSQLSLNLAIITFVSFVASIRTSTSKQPLPLPPPSSTPNLTTVTLFTTIYQSLK